MCAAYLLNLLPTRGSKGSECPYKMFYGRKPKVDHLKVFGCAAYGLIPAAIRNTKLGDTSVLCVMVGYDDTRKAYRLFNPNNHNVVVSSSCRFDESVFPFRQNGFAEGTLILPPAIGVTPATVGTMGGTGSKSKNLPDSPIIDKSSEPSSDDVAAASVKPLLNITQTKMKNRM